MDLEACNGDVGTNFDEFLALLAEGRDPETQEKKNLSIDTNKCELSNAFDVSTPNSSFDPVEQCAGALEKVVPKIHNVIIRFKLPLPPGEKIDLYVLANRCKNVSYNPRRFPAVILRQTGGTSVVFSNASFNAIGNSVSESLTQGRKTLMTLRGLFPERFTAKYCAQYTHYVAVIHANAKLPYCVNIEALGIQFPQVASYEPEIFSGLIYRMPRYRVVALVYMSGSVMLSGKTEEDIREATDELVALLANFKQVAQVTAPLKILRS
jgi:transcription initiation factor TFIID TATA-box-binding protein